MENKTMMMPANYSILSQDELIYTDGGELSERQVKVLLGTLSVLIASIQLVPNVYAFIFDPITAPIVDAVNSATNSLVTKIKNFFN